jgi:[amino group carrier protein]-lysine/ornithine hydrolase
LSTATEQSTDTQLVFDLVSTPSISGDELAASQVFVEHANQRGFESRIDEVGNAIAERSSEGPKQVHIVLLGHIDTVPGDIPVRIEDNILHGRGSVDAKGPLAAMLCAASIADLPDGALVSVVGAVGEEAAGSIGARHLAPQWSPDACIIGEPSGFDGVTLGYKGRLLCNASITCSNAHSAGAELSASDSLIQWWNAVQEHVAQHNQGIERVFDQIQASVLSFRSSSDGLTQRAHSQAGFRLPPGVDAQEFASTLQQLTPETVSVEFNGAENAHVSDRNDPVVRAISTGVRSIGHRPRPKQKTGTADLNVVAPIWNCPIAAYGPGDSSLDHAPNEHLCLQEYEQSIQVLKAAIETLAEELIERVS